MNKGEEGSGRTISTTCFIWATTMFTMATTLFTMATTASVYFKSWAYNMRNT